MLKKLNKLVKSMQNGNACAFEDFYNCTYRLLYSVAFGILMRKDLAEDAVQDAFVSIYKGMPNIDVDHYNVINYIYTVAKNKALNILKKQKTHADIDDEALINSLSDKNATPRACASLLDDCRKILSADEYEVVVLSQIKGFKRREIAEMLGSNINTITWRYQQALKKLKKVIKEGDYEL